MSLKNEALTVRQHSEGQITVTNGCQVASDEISKGWTRQAHEGQAGAARSTLEGVPALPGGPQGGEAALPCLKSNNSIIPSFYRVEGDSLEDHCKKDENSRVRLVKTDSNGRQLMEIKDAGGDVQIWLGGLSTAEKKKAFALVENIKHLVTLYGLERLGFLTLTFEDNVTDFKEAQRRFNSLATNILRKCFVNHVVTVEPQMRGAVHYHLVVVCPVDIRTGFDFVAFNACQREYRENKRSQRFHELKAAYAGSASPCLKGLWRELRPLMKRYGFGRFELLPIRSNAEGIAQYVGKYLEKGSMYRGEQFKGARMVRYSRGWRAVNQNFAWYESGLKWRKMLVEVARELGVSSMEAMRERFGRYWAYKALTVIQVYPDASPKEISAILKMAHCMVSP